MAEIIPFPQKPERRRYGVHMAVGASALAALVATGWWASREPAAPRPAPALTGEQQFNPDLNTFLPDYDLIPSCKKSGRKVVRAVLSNQKQDIVLGLGDPAPKEGYFDNGMPLTEPQITDGVRIIGTDDEAVITPLYGRNRVVFPNLFGRQPVRLPVDGDYVLAVGKGTVDGTSKPVVALGCSEWDLTEPIAHNERIFGSQDFATSPPIKQFQWR